jgi:hypothetical protein
LLIVDKDVLESMALSNCSQNLGQFSISPEKGSSLIDGNLTVVGIAVTDETGSFKFKAAAESESIFSILSCALKIARFDFST